MQHLPLTLRLFALRVDAAGAGLNKDKLAEWLGAAFGIVGAVLLASKTEYSAMGWLAFLASNICMIAFAVMRRIAGLFAMQLVFTATSVLGIWRWLG